jgi:hypothetical protein
MLKYKSDAEAGESFGLRHVVPSGLVPEIPQEDLRPGGDPGTSGTNGAGNLRGVRYRNSGAGTAGGTYPRFGIVCAEPVDWGGRANHQEPEWTGVVPRVPEFEEESVGRGDLGGWILCPDGWRPDDSRRHCEVYSASSPVRARACAAFF